MDARLFMSVITIDARSKRLTELAIRNFSLDLRGLSVLTEAASGYYALTPLIAALAGATKVYALAKDSRYGAASEIAENILSTARDWGVADAIEILYSKDDARVSQADVVTNLGFLRPLDANFLARLKPKSAIPLMWETWEFRPEDLDLDQCRRLGIPVLGTNEEHPLLQTPQFVGYIAVKLLFSMGIEVFKSNCIVLGSGKFLHAVAAALSNNAANVIIAEVAADGTFDSEQVVAALKDGDALIVAEHHTRAPLIGPGCALTAECIYAANPAVSLAHICGNVDAASLRNAHVRYAPERIAAPGFMSVATDYVGPKPLIDLHTAGLRIGAELCLQMQRGATAKQAETATLQALAFAQGFADN